MCFVNDSVCPDLEKQQKKKNKRKIKKKNQKLSFLPSRPH